MLFAASGLTQSGWNLARWSSMDFFICFVEATSQRAVQPSMLQESWTGAIRARVAGVRDTARDGGLRLAASLAATRPQPLGEGEQFGAVPTDAAREALDACQAWVQLPALDAADVVAMQAGLLSERLLRVALLIA